MLETEKQKGLERHAQTVIQIVITALLLWVGGSVVTVRESAIRIEENHKQIVVTVQRMEGDLGSIRSQITNVQNTLNANSAVVADHERRLLRLETAVKK